MIEFAELLNRFFGPPLAQLTGFAVAAVWLGGAILTFPWKHADGAASAGARTRRYRLFVSLFALTIGSSFAAFAVTRSAANQEIDTKLESGVISVLIDGVALQEPDDLIKALLTSCDTNFRRSHPEAKYDVLIHTHAGLLMLKMGQDSVVKSDYWIFYPRFGLTRENEVRRACNTGVQPG